MNEPADSPTARPRRSRRTRARRAVVVLLVLAGLAIAALYWLVASRGGARFTVDRLSQLLPGSLAVERVEGPVRGPLTLHGVRYETERFILTIEWVRLDWRLGQLRRRILDVEQLDARGVVVRILPSDEVRERELSDINLRYNVVVRALRVEDVEIFRPEQELPVVIDTLTMRTGAWRDAVRIEEIDVVSPHFDLDAHGWLRPTGDYPLDVTVAWAYRPPEDAERNLPGFAGRGTLGGTLRSLRVEQTLERPFRAVIAMTVAEPLFEPRFDGRVEVDGMDPRLFDPELPVTSATGVVDAAGTGLAAFTAEGELRLATTEWGEADTDFRLARDGERWRFDRLTLRRPGGGPTSATLAGTLVVAKGEPLRFEGKASWEALTWPLEGGARPAVRSARGTAAGEGTVDDYSLVVDGTFAFPDVPAGRYRFTAAGDQRSLRFESLDADVLGGRVAGSGRVAWRPTVTYSFQATATNIRPHEAWPGFPAELAGGTWRLTGTGDPDKLRIESLDASLLGGRVVATGNVTWEPALRYDFDATATEIRPHESWPAVPAALAGGTWHLVGAGDQQAVDLSRLHIESASGVLEGSARVQWEPELRWTADVRTRGMSPAVLFPEVPAQLAGGDWHLVGSGDDRRADIERIAGAFLGGEVAASGDFAWEPVVAWRLTGTARGIDPAQAYPGWEGDLAVDFRTTGEQRADGPHGEVVVERTAGVLRGRALDGAGTVLLRGPDVHVDAVQARWGPGTLSLDGQIAPQLSLAFRVDDLDLDALVPEAAGTLAAAGRLTGDAAAPRVDATLTGEDLAFRTYRAATLSGRAEVDLAPGGAVDLDLTATGVDLGPRQFDTLGVVAAGTREAHTIAITGRGQDTTLAVAATGALPDLQSWRGTLTELTAESRETGRWELVAPTPLVLSATEIDVDDLCWVSQGARLCADVAWRDGEELAVVANVDDLPLTLVEPFLPAEVAVSGTVDGWARLRTTRDGALIGQALLQPAPGTALWDESRGEDVRLVVESGDLRLDADGQGATAVLNLVLADAGWVRGEATLPGFRLGRAAATQPVQGRLAVQLSDIGFFEALVPELGTTRGTLVAELAIAGTLAAPDLRGEGRLTEGQVMLPRFGLELREVQLVARGDGTGPLQLEGSLRSGEGTLSFTGTAPLVPGRDQPLRLELKGRDVTVLDLEEARVTAHPDLQVTYDGAVVAVAGQVVIPEAEIDYQRDERSLVRVSPDVVYVGDVTPQATVVDRGLEVEARVRVVLGDDVTLRAMGLRTGLKGSLLVIDHPGAAAPTASGELELEQGTFRAYGQDLTIERGRLFFAGGPIHNPGIDLRAYRRVPEGNVIAGLQARGTLRAPEVSLWSDPAMGESEILSYLLIGRPLDAAKPEEGSMLANAASALGVGGGNLLAKKLAARWGLEEARFETTGGLEQTALIVGKYLSPRLYVSYGIGLFEAVNTLRVRYLVSERWSLQAQSGAVTSGDILYTIEQGGPKPGQAGVAEVPRLPTATREELTTPAQVPVGEEGVEAPGTQEPVEPVVGGADEAPDVAGEDEPDP